MKARKKPVEIDYYPIEFTPENATGLVDWVTSFGIDFRNHFHLNHDDKTVQVKTLEGTSYKVSDTDVIIRGVSGEFYPYKKDIFELTYDKLDNGSN